MWNEIELTLPKPPSLNKFYAGKHWSIRKKYKDEYTKICKAELEKYDISPFENYEVHVRYNCRYDVDNTIMVSKFLSDTFTSLDLVADDSNKYYTRLCIKVDKELEKDTFKVLIRYK